MSFPLLYKILLKVDVEDVFSAGIFISYNIGVRVNYNWPNSKVKVAL